MNRGMIENRPTDACLDWPLLYGLPRQQSVVTVQGSMGALVHFSPLATSQPTFTHPQLGCLLVFFHSPIVAKELFAVNI